MIILIGGEKGGTGKTTISTNLAALKIGEGADTLLMDTDKQGSASSWASTRDAMDSVKRVPCIQKFGNSILNEVQDLKNRYQDIIIDAGGRDSLELRSAMSIADKIFIPIQASQFDVWTLGQMDVLVQQVKAFNPRLQAYVILNRASTNPSVVEADDAREILKELEHLKLCGTIVRDRIAFRKAARSGLSVCELSQEDLKASTEMKELLKEVCYNEK